MRNRRGAVWIAAGLLLAACGRTASPRPERTSIWYLPAPSLSIERAAERDTAAPDAQGGLIILDTTSLRPVLWRRGGAGYVEKTIPSTERGNITLLGIDLLRIAVLTTYQGNRYHPETLRAITEDTVLVQTTGRRIVEAMIPAGRGLFLDMQGAAPEDLPRIVALTRAVRSAAGPRGRSPIGIIVPATDTVAYPTEVLARVADVIVVRLQGEHRSGTRPGPFASPDFISRALGARSLGIGASRIVAELPLFGLRWNADGSAREITFADASALVSSEAGSFRRDPASQYLTAAGRDGWTIWIPDAQTVRAMIAAAQRRGVTHFALSGVEGADPALLPYPADPPFLLRR